MREGKIKSKGKREREREKMLIDVENPFFFRINEQEKPTNVPLHTRCTLELHTFWMHSHCIRYERANLSMKYICAHRLFEHARCFLLFHTPTPSNSHPFYFAFSFSLAFSFLPHRLSPSLPRFADICVLARIMHIEFLESRKNSNYYNSYKMNRSSTRSIELTCNRSSQNRIYGSTYLSNTYMHISQVFFVYKMYSIRCSVNIVYMWCVVVSAAVFTIHMY